jgi:hypothetical protein
MFAYLKDRVWKKIQRWKEKLLSKAGKEILIKAVAQAIPTYAMSCFDLTKLLFDEISAIICRFWGLSRIMKRNYIGFPGVPFQVGKEKGGWVTEICTSSILLCLAGRRGGWYRIRSHFVHGS